MYDYAPGKADWLAAGLPSEGEEADTPILRDVLRPEVPTCSVEEEAGPAFRRARREGWDQCVVVTEGRVVLGRLRRGHIEKGAGRPAGAVMQEGPTTFRLNVGVVEMAAYMSDRGTMRDALVTDPEGRLAGVVFREDLLEQFHRLHEGHQGEGA